MSMLRAMGLAVGVTAAMMGGARGQSFDCSKATAPVEKVICDKDRLAGVDQALADVYRQRLRSLGAGAAAEAFRAEQRAWLVQRDKGCPISAADLRRESDAAVICLMRSYMARYQQIQDAAASAAAAAPEAPWTGKRLIRAPMMAGDMTITPQAGGALRVVINTLNIQRPNSCELDVVMTPRGAGAEWIDPQQSESGQRCRVRMRRLGASIQLDAEHCDAYCGPVAGLAGVYAP